MIAQSIYHGVSRSDSRGRKLVLKSLLVLKPLKAETGRKGQRLREHDGDRGLKIMSGAIQQFRTFRTAGGPAPLLVIALKLEAEAYAVASHLLVFITGQKPRVALDQLVVIAEQAERKCAGAVTGDGFHHAGPALRGVVEELRNIHFEGNAAPGDF